MSDSLMLEITGFDLDRLISALDICSDERVTGITQVGNKLCLSYEHDGAMRLSFRPSLLAETILEWLQRTPGSNPLYLAPSWPQEPDIDGCCERGWRLVFAKGAAIEIHPHWMVFHK